MLDLDEELEEQSWSKKLIGKDLTTIPCLQNAFLCGFTTGAFMGLASFLYTSRANLSFNVGFYTYLLTCFTYWVPCRYNYEKNQQTLRSIFEAKRNIKEKNQEEPQQDADKNE